MRPARGSPGRLPERGVGLSPGSDPLDLYVARQPIFDLRGEAVAYELLYRRTGESLAADGESRGQMSLDVIIQTFLEIGLQRITQGKLGFLNFSREMLLNGSFELLDPDAVVIELLEDVVADAAVVAACERLVRSGYTLALDDFAAGAGHDALLPLARIVKVDVLGRAPGDVRRTVEPLRRRKLRLLAERVETAEVRDACRAMGFELFQGYFFARPEIVEKRGVPVELTSLLQVMNLLQDEKVTEQEVVDAFGRDPSLSYKLLRMVNAASQGARGVDSILHAVRLLGHETLHRWLALLLASSLASRSGMDAELVYATVLRARLCELLAGASDQGARSGRLFLTGLFSRMDALLRTPMDEVLSRVDLTEDVKEALLHREGPYAEWLALSEAYERGDWEAMSRLCAAVGVPADALPEIYVQSLRWAREQVLAASALGEGEDEDG